MKNKRQCPLKGVILITILVCAVTIFLTLLINKIMIAESFWEALRDINTYYASLLSFIVAVILAIITGFYAVSAYSQKKASEKSVEVMTNQIQLDKQPCVYPTLHYGSSGSAKRNKDRDWTLEFHVPLKNIGDYTALSVQTLGYLELQYLPNAPISLRMSGPSCMTSYVALGEERDKKSAKLTFDYSALSQLLEDMKECAEHYPEYKYGTGESERYGPKLVIKVLYKNILGENFVGIVSKRLKSPVKLANVDGEIKGINFDLTSLQETDDLNLFFNYTSDNTSETEYHLATNDEIYEFMFEITDEMKNSIK